ncbi:hypothetical protein M2322_003938 [Rhodoblastus acidophilus]|uniref:hypothetical protein n=1 Tax=Rhodoblastus acidophilus TaxID=1074 RepID=UPI0022249D77|nr:hypothetical protein [Rhodoblastus acidophilus]MCW2318369.1 hypothetical protein [Rhodoblastus acidophilus]
MILVIVGRERSSEFDSLAFSPAIMQRVDRLAGDFEVFGGIKSICRSHHGMAGGLETAP